MLISELQGYLKKQAPYSVLDTGVELADNGFVNNLQKEGRLVQGVISDKNAETFAASLEIISPAQLKATCACCSTEDLEEQWCAHVVALLIEAVEEHLINPYSDLAIQDTYRINTSSPVEIASILRQVPINKEHKPTEEAFYPDVTILLDLQRERLGVQVLFNGDIQYPAFKNQNGAVSSRALDRIFMQILEDEGHWDDEMNLWFINSSKEMELILGIAQEYKNVLTIDTNKQVQIAQEALDARITIEWLESAAELVLWWILPDNTSQIKLNPLLGSDPYWTVIGTTIYKLSLQATQLAAIFPFSSSLTIPKSQMGPILEVLQSSEDRYGNIVVNSEAQPECEVKDPTPILDIAQCDSHGEHFASDRLLELRAFLKFEYPDPPTDRNVVYIPNRELEQECCDLLTNLGFSMDTEDNSYLISGDAALDLISTKESPFPKTWQVSGLSIIKKTLRFADLSLSIDLSAHSDDKDTKRKKTTGINWFDCNISLTQNCATVPLSMIFRNLRAVTDKWVRLDSGAYAKVPGGGLAQLKTTLGMLDPNYKLSKSIDTQISTAQAVNFARIIDPFVSVKMDQNLKTLTTKLQNFKTITAIEPSKKFAGKLRPYQKEGLSWMNFLADYGLDGILADEMGLGKTVQTLALLQRLKYTTSSHKKLRDPALIIAPTSVITNWMYEAKRFTPDLKVLLLHGPDRRHHFANLQDYDLVITSYALLRLDRYELERYTWSYLILDEAQNIKNPQAATTKAAKALNTSRRLALTGTPTENRPMELWSIMDFLMPGYLGTHDFFKNYIEKPIMEHGPATEMGQVLNLKTKPFLLRRVKSEVEKDLPAKIESVLRVPMTNSQRQLYVSILNEVRPKVFAEVERKGIAGATVSILSALLRLRQVCNHPNSIEALSLSEEYDSGKFNLLKELVTEAVEAKRKILLFSQFRAMLSIICDWLDTQSFKYLYLDGTTKNRQDIVDRFNEDEEQRLFVISLKAGGTGLNLTAADTVIIYDPWWNPAVESQAVDRAHRIGQTKKVSVYRLVTEDSVEQKIMDLKRKKAQIVDALINNNGLTSLTLSKKDLENFFSGFPVEEA
ncbi:MAG: SNF2-related protein [Bdellovibrionota bacterium]|jgi:superfamily II DNA or RNA helicase